MTRYFRYTLETVTRTKTDAPQSADQSSCKVASLDFENKVETEIAFEAIEEEIARGRFVWVDFDSSREESFDLLLDETQILNARVKTAVRRDESVVYERYEDCLHVSLVACQMQGIHFLERCLHVILGEKFMVTVHRGQNPIIEKLRQQYQTDFREYAETPSFLLFDISDFLIAHYQEIQTEFENQVEKVQDALMSDLDESIFSRVSELGADILRFRKVLLPTRATLTELASRKSPFVSDATQSFLSTMQGTLDRVLQDLLVARDILSESLDLHMSLVAHRTNRVVTRLTAVSIVFLPLTFLCGVYGMNFEFMPELKWKIGYPGFWVLVVLITALQLMLLRKKDII